MDDVSWVRDVALAAYLLESVLADDVVRVELALRAADSAGSLRLRVSPRHAPPGAA